MQTLLRSIVYSKMKAFALPKRLSLSTVFLVSIILTIVIAIETYQKDCVNCVNAADEYAVKKRGVFRATCYGGKCPRRRSRKRGMKMVRVNSCSLTKKSCSFCNVWRTDKCDCWCTLCYVGSSVQGTGTITKCNSFDFVAKCYTSWIQLVTYNCKKFKKKCYLQLA